MPHPSAPNAYPSAYNAYPSGPDGVAGALSDVRLEEVTGASTTTLLGAATTTLTADGPVAPEPGDVLVVQAGTWGASITITAVGGGALDWQDAAQVPAVTGQCPARCWTTEVTGEIDPVTVGVTFRNTSAELGDCSFVVERWSGGVLGAAWSAARMAPPETTVESQTVGAAIAWSGFDYNGATSDTAPVYLSGAAPLLDPVIDGGAYGAYYASQAVAAAGEQTIGLSSPTGQRTSFVAIELLPQVTVADTSPLQGLVDDFATPPLDLSRWPGTSSPAGATPPQVQDGRARVYCEAAGGSPLYSSIQSAARYALFDSEVSVEVAALPAVNGATGAVQTALIVDAPSIVTGRRLTVTHRADLGTLQFRHEFDPAVAGSTAYQDPAALQVTYRAERHRWWRIRHTGTDVVFETSADQRVWDAQRTIPAPAWCSVADMRLSLESWRENGGNDWAEFAGVNVPAAVPPDPTRPPVTVPAQPKTTLAPVPVTRLLVADTITGRVGWELPFTSLSWSHKLNAAGSLSATLKVEDTLESMYSQGAADPGNALRETLDGPFRFSYVVTYGEVAIWAGPMQPSVDLPGDTATVSVGGAGIESLLEKRVLLGAAPADTGLADPARDVAFLQTSPGSAIYQIVQAAITSSDDFPGRGLPITCSAPPAPAGEEDFRYLAYDLTGAAKAVDDIVKRDDGPDVRFVPTLTDGPDGVYLGWDLQIGDPYLSPSGPPGPDGPVPWTFDDATATISRKLDVVGTATMYFTSGSGQDRAKQIARADSSYLIGLGFPAMEVVENGTASQTDQWKLDAAARGAIAAHQTPTETWTVTARADGDPPLGTYRVGDEAVLDVRRHPLILPDAYRRRIIEMSGGGDTVNLTCEPDGQDGGP